MKKGKHIIKQRGYNPALEQFNQMQKSNKMIRATFDVSLTLTATVLHDKFGFGGKRLERFLTEYGKLLEAYNDNRFKVSDLDEVLQEECGIQARIK